MMSSGDQVAVMEAKGYRYLGAGYLHNVYEKDGLVYKGLKIPCFPDQYHKFEHEKAVLDFLREKGVPAVRVLDILREGSILQDICFLVEEKAPGMNYTKETMPDRLKPSFFAYVTALTEIRGTFWGDTRPLDGERGDGWIRFLKGYIHGTDLLSAEEREEYRETELVWQIEHSRPDSDSPRFLIMDMNPANFFWNGSGRICGVIDIDHPVFGDPLLQTAAALCEWGEEARKYIEIPEEKKERLDFYIRLMRLNDRIMNKKFWGERK